MANKAPSAFHSFKAKDLLGKPFDFATLSGSVVVVVNIASACGLVGQLSELQSLYTKYKDSKFVVLGFPSNSFAQEPKAGEELATSCARNYGVSFPILAKCEVNGPNTHPVLAFLKEQRPTGGLLGLLSFNRIKWNYEKFLVDREGRVVQRYAPTTSPLSMAADIERLLREQPVSPAPAAAPASGGEAV